MAETPEAVRAALEVGEAAWRRSHRGTGVPAAIAAFLRALPTGNGYSPHDLAELLREIIAEIEPLEDAYHGR